MGNVGAEGGFKFKCMFKWGKRTMTRGSGSGRAIGAEGCTGIMEG